MGSACSRRCLRWRQVGGARQVACGLGGGSIGARVSRGRGISAAGNVSRTVAARIVTRQKLCAIARTEPDAGQRQRGRQDALADGGQMTVRVINGEKASFTNAGT